MPQKLAQERHVLAEERRTLQLERQALVGERAQLQAFYKQATERELREAKAESEQLRQYLIESLECYTALVTELEGGKVGEQTNQHTEQATKQLQHSGATAQPEFTVQRDGTGVTSAAVTMLTPEPVVQPSSPQRAVICISYQTGQQQFMTRLRDEIEKVKRCYL